MKINRAKSLQELENLDQGDPKTAPTNMVKRCLELHRTPLEQFNAEDCRLMIGQKFSPHLLVPIALEFLADDPLESGTMYTGALLASVLQLPAEFWKEHSELWWQVNEAVSDVEDLRQAIEELSPAIREFQILQTE